MHFDYPPSKKLNSQIKFILEIDRAKQVLRQTTVADGSRRENDAEHSWHLCIMALTLAEHAQVAVDVDRVIRMLLVHDIVEIDAGDTFAYDLEAQRDKARREAQAAERIFSLLPGDQGAYMKELWEEFEERETPEARFAVALDRLQPMLQNYWSQGHAWQKHDVPAGMVRDRNQHIREGSEALWAYASALIDDAVARGYLDD